MQALLLRLIFEMGVCPFAPLPLSSLLSHRRCSRSLRSSGQELLTVSDLVLMNVLSVTLEIWAENVTKKNVQEFSHVLSNPCEPVISSGFEMFKHQVTVTCQHGCSQEGQPQNVPNENVMFGVIGVSFSGRNKI